MTCPVHVNREVNRCQIMLILPIFMKILRNLFELLTKNMKNRANENICMKCQAWNQKKKRWQLDSTNLRLFKK